MEYYLPTTADFAYADAQVALQYQTRLKEENETLREKVARHDTELKELRRVILHLVNS